MTIVLVVKSPSDAYDYICGPALFEACCPLELFPIPSVKPLAPPLGLLLKGLLLTGGAVLVPPLDPTPPVALLPLMNGFELVVFVLLTYLLAAVKGLLDGPAPPIAWN